MFKYLQTKSKQDKELPERQFVLTMRARVLDGKLYDCLNHAFHEEKNDADEYVKLRDRRPSVRYGLCRLVVEDSVDLLFSEGHFPQIDAGPDGEEFRRALSRVIKETSLNEVIIKAATRGSVGSVAIHFRVLGSRVFFSVMETPDMTPIWKNDAPDTLERVEERYKVKGKDLRAAGYAVNDDELDATFWFARDWTDAEEIWYQPFKPEKDSKGVLQPAKFARDEEKTVKHDLGFVPIVWVKNLPGGDDIDGACTFSDEVIDTGIEIDYQLSQAGRGLKYSQDPTLLIKEPTFNDGKMVRSASNAITVNEKGDAKLLEIDGTASAAVLEYVRALREMALETAHGNRSNADKVSAAQSGRAMELMHAPLIRLADKLRIAYGEGALLALLNMVCAASKKIALKFKDGTAIGKIEPKQPLALRWPSWFPPTNDDLQTMATTLRILVDSGLMSQITAIKALSAAFDIEDVEAEQKLANAEREARDAAAKKAITVQE